MTATILLIDDNAAERALTRKMLEAEGYAVSEAGGGGEGLALFRTLNPALVICDLLMPDKSGFETVQEIQKLDPAVKVVAISGVLFGFADHATMKQNLGLAAIIEKPFRHTQLLDAVRGALAKPG
jgi:DNA-binding NtrC family response regulator